MDRSTDKRQSIFPVAEVRRSRIRTVLIALLTAAPFLAPTAAFAGVNRWTTNWPSRSVSSVAIDPMNPDLVYASTSGVLKSRNGGLSWNDPSNEDLGILCLAIDPATSSTVFAGTTVGVLKSTDGGASWSKRLMAGAIYNL